jgi:hypothetical protein
MYMATQAEGILVTAGQIYVNSLDAAPRETDVISGVASIDAGEITADEITVSNLNLSGELVATGDTRFTGLTTLNRVTVTQFGVDVPSSQLFNNFQVGVNDFSIDTSRQDLVIVNGNVLATNVFVSDTLKTSSGTFLIDQNASNVLKISGNTFSSNLNVGTQLIVGSEVTAGTDSNVAVFKNGNVVVQDGFLRIIGDVDITGNLAITEIPDYTSVNNLVVSNAVIQMGTGNNGTYDTAVLMVDEPGASNIFLGYTQNDDTFKLSRTFGGPTTANFTLDSSNTTNLHILGEFYTQNNAGIANSAPMHTLAVGSNLYIDDTAGTSNILHANGYGFFEGLRVGDSGLTVGNLITMDADAPIPVIVNSVIQTDGLRTTGALPAGVANSSPTDTLSIGDVVFVNAFSGNALTVVGNTVTSRLITESIRVQDFIEVEGDSGITSVANVLIHADTDGPDTTSNAVTIVAGPVASNTSLINVFGARSNPAHQLIQFMTKKTERMRISSEGNVGIANTAPTDKLTVGGTVRVIGSNAFTMGSGTNYMKAFSDVGGTQTKIESRVGTGKGLNFYASTTDTMGVPKMTILETSNVGIGVTNPQGRLHVSGGSAFMNTPISDGYNHLTTPLVVTNTSGITGITDARPVLDLSRNATGSKAVRATFKLGKYQFGGTTSKTKLDVFLSDANYADEVDVMTLQADGRVGIGSTQPSAFLEVIADGTGNPRTNGLMVHNIHGTGDGDAIVASRTDNEGGNAFTSHIQTANGNFSSRRGWTTGVTGSTGDYRITSNVDAVSNVESTAIYINGLSRDVGIGTDAPRGKLEVNGNVVIGNQLTFGGVLNDEFGNSFMRERLYDADDGISEVVFFKGTDSTSGAGPDRIRSIAAEHLFQIYSTNTPITGTLIEDAIESGTNLSRSILLRNDGKIMMGDPNPDREAILEAGTTLFVNGGLEFGATQKIKFGNLDIFTSGGLINTFDSLGTSPIVFKQNDTEYARFTHEGLVGFGTNAPNANVHIYSGVTTDIDVLKLESPGTNTKTGIRLNTNDGYGGYVRGYTASGTTHGIVVGGMNNGAEADGLYVSHTSNVGVGTSSPDAPFHVYNGVARVESTTSSNAIIEIKTTGGTSNILSTPTGNVYVNPSSFETIINSNLEVTGDLAIDGKIDLGNQVAVDLGGATANTALHVGGGFISGSNEVACKRYSKSFSRIDSKSKDIQLRFGNGSFYAKIVAILRRRDGGPPAPVRDMSTLVLEVQGGTHDESTSVLDEVIAVGTKNLFGGDTDYPWSSDVIVGTKGIIITPSDPSADRNYSYDIHVELISSKNGRLLGLYTDNANGVDDFTGEILQTYTY